MLSMSKAGFLSEETRKTRKGLLVVCLIAFSISKIGLTVKKVNVFGSELIISNFESIPLVLGLMVLYYLFTFLSYGLDEYSAAYRKLHRENVERIKTDEILTRREIEEKYFDLDHEMENCQLTLEQLGNHEERERAVARSREIEIQMNKLAKMNDYLKQFEGSFFERFQFKFFRPFMELIAPVIIGLYTLILLLFFTTIPNLTNHTEVKKKTEKQEIVDTENNKTHEK